MSRRSLGYLWCKQPEKTRYRYTNKFASHFTIGSRTLHASLGFGSSAAAQVNNRFAKSTAVDLQAFLPAVSLFVLEFGMWIVNEVGSEKSLVGLALVATLLLYLLYFFSRLPLPTVFY